MLPQVALVEKNPPATQGDAKVAGLVPGWGRVPAEGTTTPVLMPCKILSTEEPGELPSMG